MDRNDEYDIIVVGASVAGAASSLLLARNGHKVLVIDKKRDKSEYKKVCTTFIQRSALPVISKLGLDDLWDDVGAIRSDALFWTKYGWIADRLESDKSHAHGYQLRREVMDPILIEQMEKEPLVTLRLGSELVELVTGENGNYTGITFKNSEGGRESQTAKLVVLADGRNSKGAQLAEVPTKNRNNQRFVYFAYYENLPLKSGNVAQFYQVGRDMAFAYPFDNDLTMLCCFIVQERYDEWADDKHTALEEFFKKLPDAPDQSNAKRQSEIRGMRKLNDFWRPASHRGMALVGDCCISADPMSGVGVGFALQAAEWLADSIGEGPLTDEKLKLALENYRKTHRKNLGGHEYFIQDNSTGRKMNLLETLISRAAVVDSTVAHRLHLFIGRVLPWYKFLSIGTIGRVLKANLSYSLDGDKRRFHELP